MKLREKMAPKKRKTTSEPNRISPPPQNLAKFLTSKAGEVFNFLSITQLCLREILETIAPTIAYEHTRPN